MTRKKQEVSTGKAPIATSPVQWDPAESKVVDRPAQPVVIDRIDLVHQVESKLSVDPKGRAVEETPLGVRVDMDLYPWSNIRRVRYA